MLDGYHFSMNILHMNNKVDELHMIASGANCLSTLRFKKLLQMVHLFP